MKKIIALALALGLVVPANAVNRRLMRRRVMRKALVKRKAPMDKEALTKNAIFFVGGLAVAAVICAIFVKKRDREDYVRGFTAGRATSQIPVEEDFLDGHRNLDSIRVAMHGTPEEPPTPPALPLEPSGTHTSTGNPFASGYIE